MLVLERFQPAPRLQLVRFGPDQRVVEAAQGGQAGIDSIAVVIGGAAALSADPSGDGIKIVGGEIRLDIDSLTMAV
jgi:hypothetical protein